MAYQDERVAHPERTPTDARAATGASVPESRTGANGLCQVRATAAAATGGAEHAAGAAHLL